MTYFISLKITKVKRFAFLAGLIALTSFHIILSGRDGQWDIFTHGFMLVSIYFLIKLFNETTKYYRYAVIVGVFFGFSFLSKGPVSLYALLLPFLIAYGVVFKFTKGRIIPVLLSVFVAILVSGSWSLYVYLFDTLAVQEISELEAGRWINYNVRPFYYYWSFVVQSGLWTIPAFVALLYPYLKDKVFHKKGYQFSLLWTIVAVVLLSIIPEKKSRYLLPVLFPLAINTAFYIEYLFRNFKALKAKETWFMYIYFGIIALAGLAFPVLGFIYFGESLDGNLHWIVLTSISLFVLSIYIILNFFRKNIKQSMYGTIVFVAAVIGFGLPLASEINTNEDYRGPEVIEKHKHAFNLPVYEFYEFAPELIWEYGKPIPVINKGDTYQIPKEAEFLVLVTESEQQLKAAAEVFEAFTVKRIDSIDMNPVAKKKSRLKRVLFYVEK